MSDYDPDDYVICCQAHIHHFTCPVCGNAWVDDSVVSMCSVCNERNVKYND